MRRSCYIAIMQKLITPFLFALAFTFWQTSFSQCLDGEIPVQIVYDTDAWGIEAYWELVPGGQECGSGPVIVAAGNAGVGCDGDGLGASDTQTLANNTTYVSEEFCVVEEDTLDLIYVDSYGDGGTDFSILVGGIVDTVFVGEGVGETFTFIVETPSTVPYDLPCFAYEIATDGVPVLLSSNNATTSYFEISPPGIGCNNPGGWCEGEIDHTIWAKFTVEENTRYRVATCNDDTDFDTQVALWVVDNCNDFDSYELVGANDDSGCDVGSQYSSVAYSPCLPSGTEVYIQIDGWYGASGIAELSVEAYNALPVYTSSVNNISCALENEFNPDGSINVYSTTDGLTSNASWTGPFGYTGTGNYINGLLPGVYTVELSSSCPNELAYIESFEIVNPEPLEVEAEIVSSCENGSGGSVYLEIEGGTGDYDIFWQGPEGMESEEQDLLAVESGFYSVVIEDEGGCLTSLDVDLPNVGVAPFSLGANMQICAGEMEFFFAPAGNYQYEWQDGSTNSVFILQTEEGVSTTAVVGISVENEFGCELSDAVVITVVNCAGVSEEAFSSWGLSPNPTSSALSLNIDGVQPGSSVIIRDYHGRTVFHANATSNMTLDVSMLNSGFYLVEVADERGSVVWQSKAIVE